MPDDASVPRKTLAEGDRDRVLEMRTPSGHDLTILDGLRLECIQQLAECGNQILRDRTECRYVYGRWEDIVRTLPHVHVVVRVNPCLLTALGTQNFECPVRYDLVHVHVRRCAGPGLEHVDHELVVKTTGCNLPGSLDDGIGPLIIEEPDLLIRAGGGRLHETK